MKFATLLLLTALVQTAFPEFAFFQDENRPVFSSDPFNWEIKTLPVEFRGHDPRKIFDALYERTKPKGEFETTAAYQQRMSQAGEVPVDKLNLASDLLAFEVSPYLIEYNADGSFMRVAIKSGSSEVVTSQPVRFETLFTLPLNFSKLTKDGTYESSNAYGARVTVEKSTLYQHHLALADRKYVGEFVKTADKKYSDQLEYRLPMSPDVAKDVKFHLKIFAIVQLVKPFTAKDDFHLKPTFRNPTEAFIFKNNLIAAPKGLLFVNSKTGEILRKQIVGK